MSEPVREGMRGAVGWLLVVVLLVPWILIQIVAMATRAWARRRGGFD